MHGTARRIAVQDGPQSTTHTSVKSAQRCHDVVFFDAAECKHLERAEMGARQTAITIHSGGSDSSMKDRQ